MNKTAGYLIGVLGLTIIILSIVLIYRKPINNITPFNEKGYKDSINFLNKQNKNLHIFNDSLTHAYDSISVLKQTVITKYHDKILFINDATTDELDKYIRSNY